MNQNKNMSSKLEGLFENARKQEQVMNLSEVSDLLKNPAAFQKKKETNVIRWFGIFLLIGLTAFGAYYFYNGNSDEEKSDSSLTVTTVTPSNNAASQKAPASGKSTELSAVADNSNINNKAVPTENSSIENKEITSTSESSPKESGKPALLAAKSEPKRETVNTHYAGNSTISFLSDDNRKIKMIVTPSNEVEELTINDEMIANDKFSSYKNVIDEGLKLKNDKNNGSGTENAASAEKQNIMNAMMKELSAEGLVSSNEPFDFTLTGQDLILNNEKRSQETFEKYKQVYEKITGEKLPAKYYLHIKR